VVVLTNSLAERDILRPAAERHRLREQPVDFSRLVEVVQLVDPRPVVGPGRVTRDSAPRPAAVGRPSVVGAGQCDRRAAEA